MHILTIGLSHKTAPVEIRERLHIPEGELGSVLARFVTNSPLRECLLLSTCNRVEVYGVSDDLEEAERLIPERLAKETATPLDLFRDRLYTLTAEAAVRHAFKVPASLDSMVLGESQILGQVKEAYQAALRAEATGPVLNTLMERALSAAKKVRTETGIGESPVSVPSAAIGLAKRIFGDLQGRTILVLGAGKMSELAAKQLVADGGSSLIVSNRNFERAIELAERLQGRAIRFDRIHEEMLTADIVLCSTAAPHYLLRQADLQELIWQRRNRPIFLIDIAVPRNIDPAANQIDNVYLYDIDDLEGVVAAHRADRAREADRAALIIEREVVGYLRWLQNLEVVPTIVTLRERLETIREAELTRALARLPQLSHEEQEVIRAMSRAIINKVLHQPTTELKRQWAHRDGRLYVNVLRRLFGLQDER